MSEDMYAQYIGTAMPNTHTHTLEFKVLRKENIITDIALCHIECLRLIRLYIDFYHTHHSSTNLSSAFAQYLPLWSQFRRTLFRFGKHSLAQTDITYYANNKRVTFACSFVRLFI